MPNYLIEREIPGAGKPSAAALHGIAQESCGVLCNVGPQIKANRISAIRRMIDLVTAE